MYALASRWVIGTSRRRCAAVFNKVFGVLTLVPWMITASFAHQLDVVTQGASGAADFDKGYRSSTSRTSGEKLSKFGWGLARPHGCSGQKKLTAAPQHNDLVGRQEDIRSDSFVATPHRSKDSDLRLVH